jgi:hypothetical protein
MFPNRLETLERGNVYLFFQPKVEQAAPQDVEDAPKISMVMSPEESHCYRLLLVGLRQMGHDNSGGFVDAVSEEPKNIEDRLAPEAHPTKTRGESQLPALRPIGEGIYGIVRHKDHTHFVYTLNLPKAMGGTQPPFDLKNDGSYILSIKNPEKRSPSTRDLDRPVNLPRQLQEKFRDRRFCEADPPDFLNYEGMEFVLISAMENVLAENIMEEVGYELQTEDEKRAIAEILRDLKTEGSVVGPSKALFKVKNAF